MRGCIKVHVSKSNPMHKAVSDPIEMVQNLAQLLAQRNARASALAASQSVQLPSSSSVNAAGSASAAASSGPSAAASSGHRTASASASAGGAKDAAASSSPKPTNNKLYAIYGKPHVATPKKKGAPKARGKAKAKPNSEPKTKKQPQPTEDPIQKVILSLYPDCCLFGNIFDLIKNGDKVPQKKLLDPKKIKFRARAHCLAHGKECDLPDFNDLAVTLGAPCVLFSKHLAVE